MIQWLTSLEYFSKSWYRNNFIGGTDQVNLDIPYQSRKSIELSIFEKKRSFKRNEDDISNWWLLITTDKNGKDKVIPARPHLGK